MLKLIQQQNKKWADKNFGVDRPAWQPLLGAVEEIGELSHAYLKRAQGIRIQENHMENMKDAVGDTIIYLCDFCNVMGFDIHEIVKETWDQVKQRDWHQNPNRAHLIGGKK